MRLFQNLLNNNKAEALETTIENSNLPAVVETMPDDTYNALSRFLFKAGVVTTGLLAGMGLYNAANAQTTNNSNNKSESSSWYEKVRRSFNEKVKNNGNVYRFLSPDFNFKIIRGNQYNSSNGTQINGNVQACPPNVSSGSSSSTTRPRAGILVGLFGDNDQLYNICTGEDIAPTKDNRDGIVNEIFTYNPNDGAKYEHRITGNSIAIDKVTSMLYTTGQTGTSKYTLIRTDRNGKKSSAHIDVHVVNCDPEVIYLPGETKYVEVPAENKQEPDTKPAPVDKPVIKDKNAPITSKKIHVKSGLGAFATSHNGTIGAGLEGYLVIPTGPNFSFQPGLKVSTGIKSYSDTEVSGDEKGSSEYKDIIVSNQNGQRVGAYLLGNIDAGRFHLNLGGGIDKNIMNSEQQYMFLFQFNDEFTKQEFESSGKVDFNEIYLTGGITLDLIKSGNMRTSLFGYAQVPVKWLVNADMPASLDDARGVGSNSQDNIDNYGSSNDFGQIPTNYAMKNLDKLISYGAGIRFTFGKDGSDSQKNLQNSVYNNNVASNPNFNQVPTVPQLEKQVADSYQANQNSSNGSYAVSGFESSFITGESKEKMMFREVLTKEYQTAWNMLNEEGNGLNEEDEKILSEMRDNIASELKQYDNLIAISNSKGVSRKNRKNAQKALDEINGQVSEMYQKNIVNSINNLTSTYNNQVNR
jgi:hypothetical protein